MKLVILLVSCLAIASFEWSSSLFSADIELADDLELAEVLDVLGDASAYQFLPKQDSSSVASGLIGEDIVKRGFSKRGDGLRKSRRQSKHFVCTSCHNIEREDPDLAINDPQSRLIYTEEKGMPFLQATTLYGAVNRTSFYNGDYIKKYGDLVAPAKNDIRGAIQLCATECAQGRKLKEWEVESILKYLWTIQLKIADLHLNPEEKNFVATSFVKEEQDARAVGILKTKYLTQSDATFLDPPTDREIGTSLEGDPTNGKMIYENSCLHCHYKKKYSFLHLDTTAIHLRFLDQKASTYKRQSIYQVIRYGTYSKSGKKSYMPHYTKEKMSNQQLADLRAYIKRREG